MSQFILVTGGARSGKSTYAEKLSLDLNNKNSVPGKIAYIATAEIVDKEFEERIKLHKLRRDRSFETYEENLDIAGLIRKNIGSHDVFLIECLTTWLGNIFHWKAGNEEKFINDAVLELEKLLEIKDKTFIFVSNEVGLGIVPDNEMSRLFRDMQGRLNSSIAALSLSVYFIVSGIPMKIK
jgi:adenosylcobinamide kinase / adenosylcobinamide-phosphate guanylyltransferase